MSRIKPFLPIIGTRVFVTGTRHHGFRGEVVKKPKDWSKRSIAVQLDEFDGISKFYNHNLWTEWQMWLRCK